MFGVGAGDRLFLILSTMLFGLSLEGVVSLVIITPQLFSISFDLQSYESVNYYEIEF